MTGRLFLVPNTLDFGIESAAAAALSDVLPEAVIRIAAGLTYWVAENAKTTRAFLKRVDAEAPLAQPLQALSIVELPRMQKGGKPGASPPDVEPLLAPALQGHDIGLISEAGMPAIADPGAAVVQAAHRLGVPVVALPGPSSLLLALAASGLNGQSFAFVGYLPVDSAARIARIRELESASGRLAQTQLFIETPYRNEAMLGALLSTLNAQTRLSVSCGLTLPQGWTRTDTIARWKAAPTAVSKDIPAVFCILGSRA
jgi:16S rRNA (cytidine1402-2'-O)-methyltransferase